MKDTPLFGIISANGGLFTVIYEPDKEYTYKHIQGYSMETITRHEENFPVIDFRSASDNDILSFVWKNDEPTNKDSLNAYLLGAREIGATVTRNHIIKGIQI